MAGWHHRLNRCEFEQTSGDSEGHGSLACCSPWGRKMAGRHDLVSEQHDILHHPIPFPLYIAFSTDIFQTLQSHLNGLSQVVGWN